VVTAGARTGERTRARTQDGGMDVIKAKRLRSEATARRAEPSAWGGAPDGAHLAKAKERPRPSARPPLARADLLDKATRARFEEEIDGALKRRSTTENKLAGAVRAVAALSPAL